MSIFRAVGHRNEPLNDANALTATVIAQLLHATTSARLEPQQIADMTAQALERFDSAAAVQYRAYHKG